MGAISQTNVNLVGSHCGISIGRFVCLPACFLNFAGFLWKRTLSMTPHSTPSVFRRGRSFPDGPGGFGHVPCHPNMHCVLPEWRRVHGKGSGALSKHKGQSVCFVELIRLSPWWRMRNNITVSSLSLPSGHLFHPHQQTRHRRHLLPWWEIRSGHGQGNYYTQVCDLKVCFFLLLLLFPNQKKLERKCLYLTRWCNSLTKTLWPWLEQVSLCMKPWLLLTYWPVKVHLCHHLVVKSIHFKASQTIFHKLCIQTEGEQLFFKSLFVVVVYLISTGKNIRVIDPFTIKPLDAATILASARATGGQIITVEDHYKEGWLLFEL